MKKLYLLFMLMLAAAGIWADPLISGNKCITEDTNRTYQINDMTKRLSYRFTAPYNMTVNGIRLYSAGKSGTPGYEIGIQTDSGGYPSGTYVNGYIGSASLTANSWQWMSIAATNLVKGQVYHITVKGFNASGSMYNNFVYSAPRHRIFPRTQNFDYNAQVLSYDGTWSVINAGEGGMPVFMLDETGGNNFGNPYSLPAIFSIHSGGTAGVINNDTVAGEEILWTQPATSIKGVEFYVRRYGNPGEPLRYRIYNQTDNLTITADVLANSFNVSTALAWKRAEFAPVLFETGKTYRIFLYADGVSSSLNQYETVANGTYFNDTFYTDQGYGGSQSGFITDSNGGMSFTTYTENELIFNLISGDAVCTGGTFGKTFAGYSPPFTFSGTDVISSRYIMPVTGTVNSINIYVSGYTLANTGVRVALYDNNPVYNGATGGPENLLTESSVYNTSIGWNKIPVPSYNIQPGTYWLAFQAENGVQIDNNYSVGSLAEAYRISYPFSSFPGLFSAGHYDDTQWSLYADYCEGTPVATPTPCAGWRDNSLSANGAERFGSSTYFENAAAIAFDEKNEKYILVGSIFNGSNQDMAVWRVNMDGSLDTSFNSPNGYYQFNSLYGGYEAGMAVAIDNRGKILIAGVMERAGSGGDMCVWRLTQNGRPDISFNGRGYFVYSGAGMNWDEARGVAVTTLGNVIVAGTINSGNNQMTVVKLNRDGTYNAHNSYSPGFIMTRGNAVKVDLTGNIFVAGWGDDGTSQQAVIWKVKPDLNLASVFNGTNGYNIYSNGLGAAFNALDIDAVGNIYAAGSAYNGSNNDVLVVKYTPLGARDMTFNSGSGMINTGGLTGWSGSDIATGITIDSGKLYVSGETDNAANSDAFAARFGLDGAPDPAFGINGIRVFDMVDGYAGTDRGTGIIVDNYKRIVLSAECQNSSSNTDAAILRLLDTCSAYTPTPTPAITVTPCTVDTDGSFSGGTATAGDINFDSAFGLAIQNDGKMIAAGQSYNSGNSSIDMALWRFNADGTVDTTFNSPLGMIRLDKTAGGNGQDYAQAAAIDGLGRIVVCGTSNGLDYTDDAVVWRFTKDGRPDYSFNGKGYAILSGIGSQEIARSLCVDASGNIYIAGFMMSGTHDMTVWKIKNDGTPDAAFGSSGRFTTGLPVEDRGENIFIHSNGKIVITGSCNSGTDDDMAAWMLNTDGTLYSGFSGLGYVRYSTPDANDVARSACEGSGGVIYMAGSYFSTGNDGMIVSLNSDGTTNDNFSGGAIVFHNMSGFSSQDHVVSIKFFGGRIYAAGQTQDAMLNMQGYIMKLTEGGEFDTSYNGSGKYFYDYNINAEEFNSLVIDAYGRPVIAGSVDNGSMQAAVVRLVDDCLNVTPSPTPAVTVTPCMINYYAPFGGGKVSTNNAAGGAGYEEALAVVMDGDSVIAAGNSMGTSNVDAVVVKYKYDGALDTSFANNGISVMNNIAGGNGNEYVSAMTTDSLGRILVTGASMGSSFTEDMYVARLTKNGSRDLSFNGGYIVYSGSNMDRGEDIATDAGGRIIIAGQITDGTDTHACVWRYNSNGTPDYTFNGTGYIVLGHAQMGQSMASEVEIDSSGNYIIAGRVPSAGWDDISVWKVKPDGSYDTGFNITGYRQYYIEYGQFVTGMKLDASEKIVLTGSFNGMADGDMFVMRLNSDSSFDASFSGGFITKHNIAGGGLNEYGSSVTLSNDKIIITGSSRTMSVDDAAYILRLNSDGTEDTGFGTNGVMVFDAMFGFSGWSVFDASAVDGWGRIVAVGAAQGPTGQDLAVVKLSDDCNTVVPTPTPTVSVTPCTYVNEPFFNTGNIRLSTHPASDRVNAIMRSQDGSVYIAGEEYNTALGNYDAVVWKIRSDGQPDNDFGVNGRASFNSILGGSNMDRFNAIAEAPDKSIYLAGESHNMNSMENYFVLKLNRYGLIDPLFGSSGRYTHNAMFDMERVRGIALDASGFIYIAAMERSGGMEAFTVRKLLNTGVEDITFGSGGAVQYTGSTGYEATGIIYDASAPALYACGRISMGSRVIKLTMSGMPDPSWGTAGITDFNFSGINVGINTMAMDASGRIICGGNVWDGSGNSALVLRLNSSGHTDASFSGGIITLPAIAGGTNQYAQSVFARGNSVYVAGSAMNASARSEGFIIKFDESGAPDASFDNDGKFMITDLRGAGSDVYTTGVIADSFGRVNFTGSCWNGTDEKAYLASIMSACDPVPTPTDTPAPCVDKDISFSPTGLRIFDNGFGFDAGYDLATDRNGKILVCGALTNSMGGQDMAVVRYNTDGTIDPSFGSGGIASFNGTADGPDTAYNITALPDGKILVAGESDYDASPGINYDILVWRLNENGTPDNTLNGNGRLEFGRGYGQDCAYGVITDSLGRIVVSGYSDGGVTGSDGFVRRYLTDGSSDMSFNGIGQYIFDAGGQERFMNAVVLPDNSIAVAGEMYGAIGRMVLFKLKEDGTPDTSFAPGGYIFDGSAMNECAATAIRLDGIGRIVVSGRENASGNSNVKIWRYMPSGAPDGMFATGGAIFDIGGQFDQPMGLWTDRNNRIIVSGSTGSGGMDTKGFLIRVNENGTPDNNFSNGFRMLFDAMADGSAGIDEIMSVISDDSNRILFTGSSANNSAFSDPANRDMILARGIDSCSVFNTPTETPTPPATATATHTATQGAISNESVIYTGQGFVLDAADKKVSVRFSVQSAQVLEKAGFNSYIYGTSPVYKVGVQGDDGSGNPNGVFIGPVINTPLNAGWTDISGLSANLAASTPYHLVIEYSSGSVDAANAAMVYYASWPNHQIMPKAQISDSYAASSYNNGAGWFAGSNMPVFLAGFSGGKSYGNPYAYNNGDNVYAGNQSAQLFRGPSVNQTVNKIGCYIARFGAAPADDLYFELYNVTDSLPMGAGVLWTPAMSSTTRQWVEGYLPADVNLESGKMYRLILSSPLSNAVNRYAFIRMGTNGTPYAELSYDGLLSYAQYSNDSGSSWNDWMDSDFGFRMLYDPVTPTYTVTVTPTITGSMTQIVTETVTRTVSPTVTKSITLTNTPTMTATQSITQTVTQSVTVSVTQTITSTVTRSVTHTVTASMTNTVTETVTSTSTQTPVDTVTVTQTVTGTSTQTITNTVTQSATQSITHTVTRTNTATPTVTNTVSETVTRTVTPSVTLTNTKTVTETVTGTITATNTPTISSTATPSISATNTPTVTGTFTQTVTATNTQTVTETSTPADTATQTITKTITQTVTPTMSRTSTMTVTGSITPSVTPTVTQTSTNTDTPTDTFTATDTPTFTHTYTHTYTFTVTNTYTETLTFTPSHTFTITPTFTNTPTPNVSQATDRNIVDIGKGDKVKIKILAQNAGEHVKVKIFNLTGDKVADIDMDTNAAGWNELEWDCKNRAGKTVGRGMYFMYIEHAGGKTVRRVYIVK